MFCPSKKIESIILFLLLLIYFILAAKDITLPGLNFDEVFTGCGAIGLLKNKSSYFAAQTFLFGRAFPLMFVPHHASLESYLLFPFFFLFGINVFSLRIAPISFGLFTLVFTYLFTKMFFNRSVALITILLLATSPYFISITKTGNYFHSYSIFFSITSLFWLLRWYREPNIIYFLLGIFLLGLGSSVTAWFILVVISLLVLAIIFRKDIKARIQKDKFKFNLLYFVLGIVSFCLGNFLFIYANFFNKPSRFITFKWILSDFRNTECGIDNLNYIQNLNLRFKNLLEVIRENDTINHFFAFYKEGNNFYHFIFFFILAWLIFSLLFRKITFFSKKKIVFLLALMGIMFIISPFTVSAFSSCHLSILIPFIQITVSLGLIEFIHLFKNKILQRISMVIMCFFLSILIGVNAKILKNYYMDLKRIGGAREWSDAIYGLVDWLKKTKTSNIVVLNCGFARHIYFLMQGESYIYDMNGEYKDLVKFFYDENTKYILNPQVTDFNKESNMEYFLEVIDNAGKRLIEEKIFYQRNGKPVYIVYSVR